MAEREDVPNDTDASEPLEYAIPIGYLSQGAFTLGTGFLGRRNGVISFYTAAHNMYGFEPVVTPQWDGWYQRVGIYEQVVEQPWPYQATALEAFRVITATTPNMIGGVFPLFSWRYDSGTLNMKDAARFEPGNMTVLLAKLEERFLVAELDDSITNLSTSDRLTCTGYPLPPDYPNSMWPYYPPESVSGNYLLSDQHRDYADFVGRKGFSGGPVFTDEGRFAGMQVGTNSLAGHPRTVSRIVRASDLMAF